MILVWGYILQGKKEFQEAIAFPGLDVLIQPITTNFDSIVALTFIMLEFSGQLAGTDSDAEVMFSSCRGYAISALIVLVVGGVSYLLFRKILFARYIAYIAKGGPE